MGSSNFRLFIQNKDFYVIISMLVIIQNPVRGPKSRFTNFHYLYPCTKQLYIYLITLLLRILRLNVPPMSVHIWNILYLRRFLLNLWAASRNYLSCAENCGRRFFHSKRHCAPWTPKWSSSWNWSSRKSYGPQRNRVYYRSSLICESCHQQSSTVYCHSDLRPT